MPSPTDPADPSFEDASARLDEGLRSCRAILLGYRVLLSGDGNAEPAQAGFNDDDDADEENAA
jgi:hypothetical protein